VKAARRASRSANRAIVLTAVPSDRVGLTSKAKANRKANREANAVNDQPMNRVLSQNLVAHPNQTTTKKKKTTTTNKRSPLPPGL
jgi:hypothetical protein